MREVHNQDCGNNEAVLDRAHQPPQRRAMDVACHNLESIRQENTERETSDAMERRPGKLLEGHDLAKDSTTQANMKAVCVAQ